MCKADGDMVVSIGFIIILLSSTTIFYFSVTSPQHVHQYASQHTPKRIMDHIIPFKQSSGKNQLAGLNPK